MQREITARTDLLDSRGRLAAPGYARTMQYRYNRESIRSRPLALKEWDFYQVIQGDWVLHLTIGHVSYAASISATLLNPRTGQSLSFGRMRPLPLRSMPMPRDPEVPNRLEQRGRDYYACFDVSETARHLVLRGEDKRAGRVDIDLTLRNNPENEKMVIATPFSKPGQFYLNYKENYWGATGHATIGDVTVEYGEGTTGLIDWGRGVWPLEQEWFWGNGTCFLEGEHFGFNIGWGFGNLENATENFFFYRDKGYKLGQLQVDRDERDYMKPWHFVSDDGSFDFVMEPFYDNFTQTKILFLDAHCHQIFGRWNGTARLPDGTALAVRDRVAFCEHAENRW